jgi:hypothetical protein
LVRAAKKPKEEFELWGAYPHGTQLLDRFGASNTDLKVLFHEITVHLDGERQTLDFAKTVAISSWPAEHAAFLTTGFEECNIGYMLRYYDGGFEEFVGTKPEWIVSHEAQECSLFCSLQIVYQLTHVSRFFDLAELCEDIG